MDVSLLVDGEVGEVELVGVIGEEMLLEGFALSKAIAVPVWVMRAVRNRTKEGVIDDGAIPPGRTLLRERGLRRGQ